MKLLGLLPRGPTEGTTCGCSLRGNCVNGQLCNCNNGNNYDNRWYVDQGYLFSETSPAAAVDLPVKEVGFGRFPWSDSVGRYTIGPLTCKDKVRGCPKAPSFGNTVNDADKLGHMAGDVVNYTCSEGFINPVSPSLRCGYDGAWERKTIICERVNCGDPGNSATTNRTLDGTRYGDTVTYTCKQGYKYERGDMQRNCTASGTWTGEVMTCSPGMIAFSATSLQSYFGYSSSPVPFNNATVNVGGAYSTSRGVFTAPFEGLYHIDVHLATYSSNTCYAYIVVNGGRVRTIYVDPYSNNRQRGSSSVLLQLSEGHTVHIALEYYYNYYVTLGQESTFSGFLLQHGQQT
ncbi:unnamed protein product [Owenia fusiformis]|uniref:Uncharacterized protein n=1 Tax=Owenia fusiformis TaxID=6347 RepID=A0A8S4N5Y7_OWEFU|nr:unnamed protein product [Owenia fusiformis]